MREMHKVIKRPSFKSDGFLIETEPFTKTDTLFFFTNPFTSIGFGMKYRRFVDGEWVFNGFRLQFKKNRPLVITY